MDEAQMTQVVSEGLRLYAESLQQGGHLGPFKNLLTASSVTVNVALDYPALRITPSKIIDVTEYENRIQTLEETIKEQEKRIKTLEKSLTTQATEVVAEEEPQPKRRRRKQV